MSASGATFTDWQQVESEHRPLMDEDFSWSEVPTRSRRGAQERPIRRRVRERLMEPEPEAEQEFRDAPEQEFWAEAAGRASAVDAEFERARQRWDEACAQPAGYAGDVASYSSAPVVEDVAGAFDLSDAGRRTVVITGRGDDRYMPALTRRRSSELKFHERAGFNPDRTALWAVVLAFAVLVGCFAH